MTTTTDISADDLIERLAREAGAWRDDAEPSLVWAARLLALRRFAVMVVGECRDAVCDVHADADEASNAKDAAAAFDGPQAAFAYMAGYQDATTDCDEAIRAKFGWPK